MNRLNEDMLHYLQDLLDDTLEVEEQSSSEADRDFISNSTQLKEKPTDLQSKESRAEKKRNGVHAEIRPQHLKREEPNPGKSHIPEERGKKETPNSLDRSVLIEQEHSSLEQLQKQKLQALLDYKEKPQLKLRQKVEEKVQRVAQKELEQDIELKPVQPLVQQQVTQEQAELVKEVPTDAVKMAEWAKWHKNGRPMWAQEDFDVLLFDVSGLTLAVPLIALGQIQQITQELTPIFGQSDWFMGLLPSAQGNIKTVNTALFVMPERYNESFLGSVQFVVSIDGLNWGLAVDSVNQPTRLNPDEVKWRTDRSKRSWLAGTVKSAMCALIDIPQMGKILSESEK